MKPYKLETKFYVMFTLITVVISTPLAKILQNIVRGFDYPSVQMLCNLGVIEAPTVIILVLGLFWIYNMYLWKTIPFKYFHNIPNINGRFEGVLESSYSAENKYNIVIEIEQTLTNIYIKLYSEKSPSYSIISNIGKNEQNNWSVYYIYQNCPTTVNTDQDMRDHTGSASFEIFNNGSRLKGNYFSNPRNRGRYGNFEVNKVDIKLKGHF